MLYNYMVDTFGFNEPIFISDIDFNGYSRIWISKELARLCEDGKVIRYEKGLYYVPQNTVFGKSSLNPNKVIKRKYLTEKGENIGFLTGTAALQQIGLSTQIPNIIEIQTNNESSKLRRVKVGSQEVILRKPKIKINNENINVLRLFDIMNNTPANLLDTEKREVLKKWINESGITREQITKFSPASPDKAMRNLIESGVIYYAAQ